MHRPTFALAASLAVAACGNSDSKVGAVTPTSAATIGSSVLGGASDGLAAELLLAGATPALPAWHSHQVAVQDPELAAALDAMALDHLRSASLGAGTGPLLVGSTTIRRLAATPAAPLDQNGSGSNLDETLAAETERITAFAGMAMPAGTALPLLPWHTRSAELSAPLPNDNGPSLPFVTRDLSDHALRMTEVAHFAQLRAIASRRLLRLRHGGRYGATADEGTLGLLAMQQLLAAEDNLFTTMFTTGGPLGPLADPDSYDPGQGKHWLPSEVEVDLDPAVAGAPRAFRALDGASDLVALATLLRAATDLISVTDTAAAFALPELFRAQPFFLPPPTPAPPSITWAVEIGPLMMFRCGGCHFGPFGGFSILTYEEVLLGGTQTRALNLPFIVPGNAGASMLHSILVGPPPPFQLMPQLSPLPAVEIARIDAWINGGALKDPPAPPAPPQPGEDLARVSFYNLVALHLDEATGALHHRYESDGPSGVATALATGHALAALAELDRIEPSLQFRGWTPRTLLARVVEFVNSRLVDGTGRCADAFVLDADAASGTADLRAQAAMTAGLLDAASRLPANHVVQDLARAAATWLLTAFVDWNSGLFAEHAGSTAGAYAATTLTDLLAALRLAQVAAVPGATERRAFLLARLRPALAFAEWNGHGEVLGDGIADTDGDGLPEPAAAGGVHGRLPLLADRIVFATNAPTIDRPVTWSEHVRPLLLGKCSACHFGGNTRGMYQLDTVRALATPGESFGAFPLLVPGDPDASFFLQKLNRRQPALGMQMPLQGPPLDDFSVALVRRWILQGATSR